MCVIRLSSNQLIHLYEIFDTRTKRVLQQAKELFVPGAAPQALIHEAAAVAAFSPQPQVAAVIEALFLVRKDQVSSIGI